MNPKNFLRISGIILILTGVLGVIGILGSTAFLSIFDSIWWFDNAENYAHFAVGIIGLIFSFVKTKSIQKLVTFLIGLFALTASIYGFLIGENFLGAILQNPLDNIFNLVFAVWAFTSLRKT